MQIKLVLIKKFNVKRKRLFDKSGEFKMVKLKCFSGLIALAAIVNLFVFPSNVRAITEAEHAKISDAVVLYIGSSDSYVNATKTKIDSNNGKVVPIVKNGRTLVPVRFIAESMKAEVGWDAKVSTAKIALGKNTALLKPGKKVMLLNNKEQKIDAPAEIIEGRTYLPLRTLVENVLGKNIFYDRNVIIISEKDTVFDKKADKSLIDDLIYLYGKDYAANHISGGYSHSAAIKKDGTVWVWGESLEGNILIPERVDGLEQVIDVSAGSQYTLALKRDGTVWAWGQNKNGSLGNSAIENSKTPVQVKGLTGIRRVAASYDGHCLALKSDGTVWSWGMNSLEYREEKSEDTQINPVQLKKLPKIEDIAVGYGFSVAMEKDGTVWTWGIDSSEAPEKVEGITGIIDISAGQSHVLALKNDGTLWTWGSLEGAPVYSGQVEGNLLEPVKVKELSGIVGISAQGGHSAALKDNGSVYVWGNLGENLNSSNPLEPTLVKELSGVKEIASGISHIMALKGDGTLWAFGGNGAGQIGDGTLITRKNPSAILFSRDPMVLVEAKDTDSEIEFNGKAVKELDILAEDIISEYGKRPDKKSVDANSSIEVITVDNAKDLINAIGSNREIVLKNGPVYNITDALNEGAGNENAYISNEFDGPELVINKVENLTIRSESSEMADLLVSPSYADVLNFKDSRNIILDGVNAGHGPEKGECSGGVVNLEDCKNVYINNSVLFGCGTEGVKLSNVDGFVLDNSVIEDCSYDLMSIDASKNVLFQNSKFRYTGIYDLINVTSSQNVMFTSCEISNNEAFNDVGDWGYHLFKIKDVSPKLIVKDTIIKDNKVNYVQVCKGDIYFKNITSNNNEFSKGMYEVN